MATCSIDKDYVIGTTDEGYEFYKKLNTESEIIIRKDTDVLPKESEKKALIQRLLKLTS